MNRHIDGSLCSRTWENELAELEQSSVVEFLKDAEDDSVVELSDDEE